MTLRQRPNLFDPLRHMPIALTVRSARRRFAAHLAIFGLVVAGLVAVPATGAGATQLAISDFAGNYTGCTPPNCGADGSAPTAVELAGPSGVAVDQVGDVFVADSAENVVRFVPKSSGTYFGKAMTGGNVRSSV